MGADIRASFKARVFTPNLLKPHLHIPINNALPKADWDRQDYQAWREEVMNDPGMPPIPSLMRKRVINPSTPLVSVGGPWIVHMTRCGHADFGVFPFHMSRWSMPAGENRDGLCSGRDCYCHPL